MNIPFLGSKERDAETGLDYFIARYYASTQGRFTGTDPYLIEKRKYTDPQLWNMYSYVRNNPLKFVDPTGKILEIAGDEEARKRALEAIRNGLRAEDRDKVRIIEGNGKNGLKKGHFYIDAKALNASKNSKDENFQALRQLANSPGKGSLEIKDQTAQFSYTDAGTGRITTTTFSLLNPGATQEQLDNLQGVTALTFVSKSALTLVDKGGPTTALPGVTTTFVNGQIQNDEALAVTTAHELYGHMHRAFMGAGRQVYHNIVGDPFDILLGQIEERTRQNFKDR
ncbi:MAG: RHS repeat-associated core domain-containing protein [Blastocatellales bacterium]|nr:RHS repeat-associated core domain-containing protein [Blastocatellales bacterium]